MTKLVLHDYWRSGAAYRVRIALNLKGLTYDSLPRDLRTGEQRSPDYLAKAPQGLVPALETDEGVLFQSMAIIEWLDEACPQPALIPGAAHQRALVRAMAQVVACDIHPLGNLRVLKYLAGTLNADQPAVDAWIRHWIAAGFAALEALVERHGGRFASGDTPTLIECCLIPQIYAARRFAVDLSPYPRLIAIDQEANQLEAFALAHPSVQPGAS